MLHYLVFYCAMAGLVTDSTNTAKQDTSQYHCPPPPFFVSNAYSPNCEVSQCMYIDVKYAVDYYQIELFDRWGEPIINYKGTPTNAPDTDISKKFEDLAEAKNTALPAGTYVLRLTLKPVGAAVVSYCSALTIIR